MILFALVYAAPIITVFYTSLCDYTAFSAPAFQGIKNFITIFSDSDFICSIRNTLLWVVLQSTLHVGVGLAMALVLRRKPKGWKIARTAYMIPNIIPTAATGVMFTLLLNPMFGIVKPVLDFFGVNYAMVPNLFGNSRYAFWTVTATWIFYSGFNTIIFLAEMGAVSKEIYEAAAIDGSSCSYTLWHIIFPICKPILVTVAIIQVFSCWNEFSFALVLIKDVGLQTVPLALTQFKGQFASDYPKQMAAMLITMSPIVILYFVFSKQIIKGMVAGAVKG